MYRDRVFDAAIIELCVRWHSALGDSVCTRVRETVASFRAPYRLVFLFSRPRMHQNRRHHRAAYAHLIPSWQPVFAIVTLNHLSSVA
jgi:hypothetical protein